MRPQHITAENIQIRDFTARGGGASMRPQHITAENVVDDAAAHAGAIGFNEAAAYHCGKRCDRGA